MAINPNKQGTGYINIRNYLQANPNTNLGQNIKNQYGNELESLGKSFQGAQMQFGQDLLKSDVDTAENRAARASMLDKPEDVVADPNKLQEFSKYLNPSYSAPSTTNLSTQAGISQQMAQDIVNPAYRTNLLQRYYGQRPNAAYSLGQKTLDSVFLNTPQSTASLGEARRGALQQLGQQKAAISGAQEQIRATKGKVEQFGKDTQSQLAGKIGEYVDEKKGKLTERLGEYKGLQEKEKEGLSTALKTGQFTPELAQKLGLSAGQGLYGLSPEQILTQANLSLSNIATPEERARLNALYKLKGETGPLSGDQTIGKEQLGSYDTDYVKKYLEGKGWGYQKAKSDYRFDPTSIAGPLGFFDPNAKGTGFRISDTLPIMNYGQATDYFNQLEAYLNKWSPEEKARQPQLWQEQVRQLQQGRAKLAGDIENIDKQFNIGSKVTII